MKSEKKVLASLLTLSIVFILFGCGSSVSTMNEKGAEEITDTVESGVSADKTIDKVEEIKEEEEETTDKPAEATASPEPTATASPTPTATPEPTSTPSPSPEPTPEPHVHEYVETVTRQATCAEAGERQLVCQGCGDVKVEAIPATGEHNWEPVYQTVTHPSTGHVEQRETQVQVGTSETRHEYECKNCGYRTNTPDELADHRASFVPSDPGHATAGTIIYDYPGEPIYETVTESVWVVDVPETTTQELVGYKCSCGATK